MANEGLKTILKNEAPYLSAFLDKDGQILATMGNPKTIAPDRLNPGQNLLEVIRSGKVIPPHPALIESVEEGDVISRHEGVMFRPDRPLEIVTAAVDIKDEIRAKIATIVILLDDVVRYETMKRLEKQVELHQSSPHPEFIGKVSGGMLNLEYLNKESKNILDMIIDSGSLTWEHLNELIRKVNRDGTPRIQQFRTKDHHYSISFIKKYEGEVHCYGIDMKAFENVGRFHTFPGKNPNGIYETLHGEVTYDNGANPELLTIILDSLKDHEWREIYDEVIEKGKATLEEIQCGDKYVKIDIVGHKEGVNQSMRYYTMDVTSHVKRFQHSEELSAFRAKEIKRIEEVMAAKDEKILALEARLRELEGSPDNQPLPA